MFLPSEDFTQSPSSVLITDGDYEAHISVLILNLTLHRLGCMERFSISVKPPSDLVKDRFYSSTSIRENSRVSLG